MISEENLLDYKIPPRWVQDGARSRELDSAPAKALTSHSPYSTKDETEIVRHSSSQGVCYK